MTDNSQMKTFAPSDGIDVFREVLDDITANTVVYAVYSDTPDVADNGDRNAAAVLVPVGVWNDYAQLRNNRTDQQSQQLKSTELQLEALQHQAHQAAREPRRQAVKLALTAVGPTASAAALLKVAKDIESFLTDGTVPEGGLTHG